MDHTCFIGKGKIKDEIIELIQNQVITEKQSKLIFGRGYAANRNSILYMDLKENIDYLLFLDDDEYPIAVTKNGSNTIWGGQHGLQTHLTHIKEADITNGHHCGYISPIPYIEFNDCLKEADFKVYIKAISNDIINWDSIKSIMENGGVTYADLNVLDNNEKAE